jgi:hypothetical protein
MADLVRPSRTFFIEGAAMVVERDLKKKRSKSEGTKRYLFLFNDMLLITKTVKDKERYKIKEMVPLSSSTSISSVVSDISVDPLLQYALQIASGPAVAASLGSPQLPRPSSPLPPRPSSATPSSASSSQQQQQQTPTLVILSFDNGDDKARWMVTLEQAILPNTALSSTSISSLARGPIVQQQQQQQ